MLKVKRAYEAPSPSDGFRVLVERLWALRRRTENIMDRWDGRAYRRALLLKEA